MKADETYCLQQLRSHAYEHYLAVLFAPQAKRGALAALYAFQLEILHIGAAVKEPLLGEMRLQWWRESLAACFKPEAKAAEQSPLIGALMAAIRRYDLPSAPFLRFCEAERLTLYADSAPSRAAFENYCDDVYAAFLRLACHILAESKSSLCGQACSSGGLAQGAAALLRHLPRAAEQGRLFIPAEILAAAGADRQSLSAAALPGQAGESAAAAGNAAARKRLAIALIAAFQDDYRQFKQAQKALPAVLRPAFLPLAVLPAYAKLAAKQPEAIFTQALAVSPLSAQFRLGRAAVFNRF